MTGPALRAALDSAAAGVFAVVATAGTTNAGVIDDLAAIADVCEERGLWLHIDGAYGGAAMAVPAMRDRFAGIERSTSFVVDPHKWLFAPYDAAALLYREPLAAARAHTQEAAYLAGIDHREWNPGDLALHLTRRPRGLPLWFSLAAHGTDRYAEAIEAAIDTARSVAAFISDRDGFELVMEPELSVVLFERQGWSGADYTDFAATVRAEGWLRAYPTTHNGRPVMRLCFIHPECDPAAVEEFLDRMAVH